MELTPCRQGYEPLAGLPFVRYTSGWLRRGWTRGGVRFLSGSGVLRDDVGGSNATGLDLVLTRAEAPLAALRLEEFGRENGVPDRALFRMQLAVDELLVNVADYAFAGVAHEPHIRLVASVTRGKFTVTISDNGNAFDPLNEAPVPDTTLVAEDRPNGGLGVYLAKRLVSEISYKRSDGRNRITLVNNLEQEQQDQEEPA